MQDAGVIEHGFESGGGGDYVAGGIEEGVVGSAEDFRGAAAEDDVFGLQVVFLREGGDYFAIGCVGVTVGDGAAVGEGCAGLGRRAVGIFVEVEADGAQGHR